MNVTLVEASVELAISIIIFLGCVAVVVVYIYEYMRGKGEAVKQATNRYFLVNTILGLSFGTLCCVFVMAYFIWIVVDPLPVDMLYFFHESHTLRVVITVMWYCAKIFPFLVFNGRLKYAFRGKYGTSPRLFVSLNIIVVVLTSLSITVGYLGVFVYPNPFLQWIGFNLFRLLYIVLLMLLSGLFNKRIFMLISTRANWDRPVRTGTQSQISAVTATMTERSETGNANTAMRNVGDSPMPAGNDEEAMQRDFKEMMDFLVVVVKSSVLLTFMIVSNIIVMVTWFFHNYHTNGAHITLTVGFVTMAFDCFVDNACLVLLFKQYQKYYAPLCGCTKPENLTAESGSHGMHFCYVRCCTFLVRSYATRQVSREEE